MVDCQDGDVEKLFQKEDNPCLIQVFMCSLEFVCQVADLSWRSSAGLGFLCFYFMCFGYPLLVYSHD